MKIWQVTVTDPISWIPVLRVSPQNRWWCFALAIKLWRIGWQLANLPQTTRSSYPPPTTAPCLCHKESNFYIFPLCFHLYFSSLNWPNQIFMFWELKFERSLQLMIQDPVVFNSMLSLLPLEEGFPFDCFRE